MGSRKFVAPGGSASATGAPLALARFTPGFPNPGRYRVEVTWPKGANAEPVRYVISHAGGTDTVSLVQNGYGVPAPSNAGTWHSLGEYDFAPGTDHFVELRVMPDTRAVDTRNACQAFADAVRFTPAGAGGAGGPAGSAVLSASPDSAPLPWLDSVPAASAEAARTGKKILVFFYSPTSERSVRYEKELFEAPAVKTLLRTRFVPVRLNIQTNADLAARMHTYKACTINLYDSKGNGLGQITDSLSPAELAAKLQAF